MLNLSNTLEYTLGVKGFKEKRASVSLYGHIRKNFNKLHISGPYLYVPQADFASYEGQWPPHNAGTTDLWQATPRHVSWDLQSCLVWPRDYQGHERPALQSFRT